MLLLIIPCLLAAATTFHGVLASHEFINNVPDSRCERRGQFLTHPHNRCKYVVCEFGSGTGGYNRAKMYARVMPCAPGTAVPYSQYQRGVHSIHGVPCTQHYNGRCPASPGGRFVHRSSSSSYYHRPSSSYHHGRNIVHNRYESSSRRPSSHYSRRSGRNNGQHRYRTRSRYYRPRYDELPPPRRSSYYAHPQGRSAASIISAASSSSAKSYPVPSASSSKKAPLEQKYLWNKPDGRCTRVGQYMTHPTNRCRYVMCEYARHTLQGTGVVYDPTLMYARIMPCAPGTAVPASKYTSGSGGQTTLHSAPCTDFYKGHCPARPPSSSVAAKQPLAGSSSRRSLKYY